MPPAAAVGRVRWPGPACSDPAYRALIAARNPAAWWPMDDDGTGDLLVDASGNGENASLTPGGFANYLQPGPQGAPCSFAVESGAGSFFESGVTIGATQHYAMMITLRADAAPSDRSPMATWDGPTGAMLYSQLGAMQLYHNTGVHVPGYTYPVGDWIHALWGWDGSTLSLWVDGVNLISLSTATGPGAGSVLYIGTYDNRGISRWDGPLQHGVLFLDGDADAVLNDTDAAVLAAAALGA